MLRLHAVWYQTTRLYGVIHTYHKINVYHCRNGGTQWHSWLRCCATSQKVAGLIPDGVIGIFHWQSFRLHYGPRVDPASKGNERQEYFLWGRGSCCVGQTTLPPSCAVLKYDSLNLLEPSGPVQACSRIAVPFFLVTVKGAQNFPV
jgi:hypothetical protein